MTRSGIFEITTPEIDVEKLVQEIRATVEQKSAQGAYTDARVGRAERTNLLTRMSDNDGLHIYLECLHEAVQVDISNFEILERRRYAATALTMLKKGIWNLLKFYTYRLWSQQNQINALLLSSIERVDAKYQQQIDSLKAEISHMKSTDT